MPLFEKSIIDPESPALNEDGEFPEYDLNIIYGTYDINTVKLFRLKQYQKNNKKIRKRIFKFLNDTKKLTKTLKNTNKIKINTGFNLKNTQISEEISLFNAGNIKNKKQAKTGFYEKKKVKSEKNYKNLYIENTSKR
ncbi:hypothetical protein [Chryseobacterium sp.]|uniref:hypothetical protein n=1 Tax=Chryseobacterium sp. TaxID=1871047 RepID=UPI00321A89FC